MAAPKKLRTLAGVTTPAGAVVPPLSNADLYAAVVQLQNTVNEVIVRYNAHATAAHAGANAVTGAAQAASNLFTTN